MATVALPSEKLRHGYPIKRAGFRSERTTTFVPPITTCSYHREDMQIQQLRYFLAVIDHGGFTRAATYLGRTQQAISKSLRQLETELGVRLLDREFTVPRPTAFGHEFAKFARQVITDELSLRQTLQDATIQRGGRLRIGASPTAATGRVAAAVENFERRHPEIFVSIVGGIQNELLVALSDHTIDMAVYIRTHPNADDTPGVIRETLGYESYRIIAGRDHPLCQHVGDLTPRELAAHPWIRGSNLGDIEAVWREPFDSAGVALQAGRWWLCPQPASSGNAR